MLYIWGTGQIASEINELLGSVVEKMGVVGYIDNDSSKWEKEFYGKQIYSPEVLRSDKKAKVYIANRFKNEIKQQIESDKGFNVDVIEDNFIARGQILARYNGVEDEEIKEITSRLEEYPLQVFNYEFVNDYCIDKNDIYFDDEKKLFYVYYCDKKMYFSSRYKTKDAVCHYYKSILIEQDKKSPHLYLTEKFNILEDTVVIDAGVAEGNFSLSIIDKVKKIYMFEPDVNWYEALQYTFEPYKDKVVIINKFVSNYSDDLTVKLDDVVREKIDFIKMDIEGEELYALKGASNILENTKDIKCSICTYHQEFAYEMIKEYLKNKGMKTSHSQGYMWYPDSCVHAPVLRRGLIYAEK